MTWQERAACLNAYPEVFDYTTTDGPNARASKSAAAKHYCDPCPVRNECLLNAMGNLDSGIFGGLLLLNGVPIRVGQVVPPLPHGTIGAYSEHLRMKEDPMRGLPVRAGASYSSEAAGNVRT